MSFRLDDIFFLHRNGVKLNFSVALQKLLYKTYKACILGNLPGCQARRKVKDYIRKNGQKAEIWC